MLASHFSSPCILSLFPTIFKKSGMDLWVHYEFHFWYVEFIQQWCLGGRWKVGRQIKQYKFEINPDRRKVWDHEIDCQGEHGQLSKETDQLKGKGTSLIFLPSSNSKHLTGSLIAAPPAFCHLSLSWVPIYSRPQIPSKQRPCVGHHCIKPCVLTEHAWGSIKTLLNELVKWWKCYSLQWTFNKPLGAKHCTRYKCLLCRLLNSLLSQQFASHLFSSWHLLSALGESEREVKRTQR